MPPVLVLYAACTRLGEGEGEGESEGEGEGRGARTRARLRLWLRVSALHASRAHPNGTRRGLRLR